MLPFPEDQNRLEGHFTEASVCVNEDAVGTQLGPLSGTLQVSAQGCSSPPASICSRTDGHFMFPS